MQKQNENYAFLQLSLHNWQERCKTTHSQKSLNAINMNGQVGGKVFMCDLCRADSHKPNGSGDTIVDPASDKIDTLTYC